MNYNIYTKQDFLNINNDLYGNYFIMNDIDFLGGACVLGTMRGNINGNGFSIRNIVNNNNPIFLTYMGAYIHNIKFNNCISNGTGDFLSNAFINTDLDGIYFINCIKATNASSYASYLGAWSATIEDKNIKNIYMKNCSFNCPNCFGGYMFRTIEKAIYNLYIDKIEIIAEQGVVVSFYANQFGGFVSSLGGTAYVIDIRNVHIEIHTFRNYKNTYDDFNVPPSGVSPLIGTYYYRQFGGKVVNVLNCFININTFYTGKNNYGYLGGSINSSSSSIVSNNVLYLLNAISYTGTPIDPNTVPIGMPYYNALTNIKTQDINYITNKNNFLALSFNFINKWKMGITPYIIFGSEELKAFIKINGIWKQATDAFIKNNTWKNIKKTYKL